MRLLAPWRRPATMWEGMDQFRKEMDQVFNQFVGAGEKDQASEASTPFMNVWEDEDSVFVEAELPGIKLEDLDISILNGNQLFVRGTRVMEEQHSAEWFRRERPWGKFERAITLPSAVDSTKVDARLENGVLTIEMAKSAEAKPTKITVHGV